MVETIIDFAKLSIGAVPIDIGLIPPLWVYFNDFCFNDIT
jgi:hypothetical protein